MIEEAVAAGMPKGVVLADCDYGNKTAFRDTLDVLGLQYAVEVQSTTMLRRVGTHGRLGERMSVAEVGAAAGNEAPHRDVARGHKGHVALAVRSSARRRRPR